MNHWKTESLVHVFWVEQTTWNSQRKQNLKVYSTKMNLQISFQVWRKQTALTWRWREAPGMQAGVSTTGVCVCVSRGSSTDLSSTGESRGPL